MSLKSQKKPRGKAKPRIDLIFHFIDPKVEVELEDGWFDEDSEKEIIDLIDGLKKSIWIDKTYVGFEETKYSDVFLTEDGWKHLCELIVVSGFGKYLPPTGHEQIAEAYSIMIACYLYGEVIKHGWDYEHIKINLNKDEDIDAEIYLDETPNDSWKDYRGTWQDLEEEVERKAKKKGKND
jgi:hypothetical protein